VNYDSLKIYIQIFYVTSSVHSKDMVFCILHTYPLERHANRIMSFISYPLIRHVADISFTFIYWKSTPFLLRLSYLLFAGHVSFISQISRLLYTERYAIQIMPFTSNGKTCQFSWFIHMNSVTYLLRWLTAILNVLGFTWWKTLFKARNVALSIWLLNLQSWRMYLTASCSHSHWHFLNTQCVLLHRTKKWLVVIFSVTCYGYTGKVYYFNRW
jgi:hypothetical protein